MSILTLLDMTADERPEAIGIVADGVSTSFGALRGLALGAAQVVAASGAAHLVRLGVAGLADPTCLFGAAAAAVPYVPLNYRLTPSELDALVDRLLPAFMVIDPDFVPLIAPRAGLTVRTPDALLAEARASGATAGPAEPDPDAPAVLLFTSGTTGSPKAAVLRHQNLLAYVTGSVEFCSAEVGEAALVSVPPYHIAGVSAIMTGAFAGRCLVILGNFTAAGWIAACDEREITNAFVVPTMLARIVDQLDQDGRTAPSVGSIAYGGGRMPERLIRRALAMFPDTQFTNAYGLTETSSTIAILTPDDHRAAIAAPPGSEAAGRIASVGRALSSVELEIRDDRGRPVPPGITGTVVVRGDQVSGEYGGVGRLLDSDGWFDTRDRGRLDADGYLYLDGRADDVIVRGGENISPGEVETALTSHPAVKEAAAVSVPDEEWGEVVGAAVVLLPGMAVSRDDLGDWVGRRLRSSRVPAHILFETELPYNEMGKLLRRVVRARMTVAAVGGQS